MADFTQTGHGGRAAVAAWTLTDADATGAALRMPGAPDRCLQLSGNFGGGTVVLEGSNSTGVWNTLHAPDGAELSFTSAAIAAVLENPIEIRPRLSGATGGSVLVTLANRS